MIRSLIVITLVVLACFAQAKVADAHWRPGLHNQQHAIVWAFCNRNDDLRHPCRYGREALVVARGESGDYHWYGGHCNRARNGQYRGCFQMGERERSIYGHGHTIWRQARAAWRYFVRSGRDWSPWSCKPSGNCS